MKNFARFENFVEAMTRLVESGGNEASLRFGGRRLLEALVTQDDWLPETFAQPDRHYYRQYLLHADPLERFSVVSFVWGPGQSTPLHDHTVWGLIGMLRGAEREERYECREEGWPMCLLGESTLYPGKVSEVSPVIGDIHRVANVYRDQVSISVHVYGGNIGRISRHVFDQKTSTSKTFVSGYSNAIANDPQ
ncbi:cysteine dioxygenase [Trinickia caryophylli]|uniref:Predicted metal-dependent enzyme of the double-stranded beta helix superfamily n=1 Tax=Trinickia caryophylli TaxID=28094 RepID=A0A1X7H872_TRICW|nr:cysteine dioxygenase [Trinickia caryophylli]PMS09479.1 cysteine dioxygenase [Trinickia caryophylli]TRX14088.1 cysteine dioxygenase [Trinickia caryophylli]WQE13908.1 cysteine dioxygenase [Trinickia caryophylli]SMF81415.1 Predicted metal-dependent enzyme of the double-stranded beta helix superfamily [Trinickia caryophylli]GLU35749.1 hypothetical protein Busp01_55910 [Trinickia caryophylli]